MKLITRAPGAGSPADSPRAPDHDASTRNPGPYVIAIVLAGIYVLTGLATIVGGLDSGVATGILAFTFACALAVLAVLRFWWFLLVLLVARAALDGIHSSANQAGQVDPSTIVGALFIVVGVTWLFVQWRSGLWTPISRTAKFLALFALMLMISTVGASNIKDSFVASSRVVSVMIFLVVFEQIFSRYPERINAALAAMFASLLIPVVVGVWQIFHKTQATGTNGENLSRIHGTFVHPNVFAVYLVVLVLLAVGLYPHVSLSWRRAIILVAVVSGPLIVLTYARGAWVGLCIGLFFLGFTQSPRLVVTLLIGIIVVVVAVPSVASRLSDLDRGKSKPIGTRGASVSSRVTAKVEPDSLTWRVDYWGRVIPLLGENPVTGIGFEMVRETTPEHEPPHDVFIQTLVEGGIAAFVAFLALLTVLALDLRNAWRRARRGFQFGMTVATIAAALGLLVELLTENLLAEVALLWYFLVPVAWVLAVVGRPGPVASDPPEPLVRASA